MSDHLINDTYVEETFQGGFVFLRLRDSDDGDTYLLGEDEILALHDYLASTIRKYRLRPCGDSSLPPASHKAPGVMKPY